MTNLPVVCRFTLELDAIKWHLCHDRIPFVDASIVGVMLDSIQNKDMSGESPALLILLNASSVLAKLFPRCSHFLSLPRCLSKPFC